MNGITVGHSNGDRFRTADGEVVKAIDYGSWAEEPDVRRVWLKYRDGDVGSLPVEELNERLETGEWETVKSSPWDGLAAGTEPGKHL